MGQSKRRVILVNWKNRIENSFEIFSNLQVFCQSYPGYGYNTLIYYLTPNDRVFEDEKVRIERIALICEPLHHPSGECENQNGLFTSTFEIWNLKRDDIDFWLTRSPEERLFAAEFFSLGQMEPINKIGLTMDKTIIKKGKSWEDDTE
jgi:hypothetical protein